MGAKADEEKRKEMETTLTDTIAEKEKLFAELQAETDRLIAAEEKLMQTQTLKDKINAEYMGALEKLEGEEHTVDKLEGKITDAENKIEELNAKTDEMSNNIHRLEQEKTSRDKQIDALNEDISRQDESIAKLGKEKKGLEENLQERTE